MVIRKAIDAIWQRFLDTNIAIRLGLGLGILVFLIFAFSLLVLYQMSELKDQGEVLYRHPFTVSRAVDAVEIRMLKIHREMKGLAHAMDSAQIHTHQSRVEALHEEALHYLDTAGSRFLGDRQLVEYVHQSLLEWRPIRDE